MGRQRRTFTRPEGKRRATLLVIATEGTKTEPIYFEALARRFENKGVHVVLLERSEDKSDPDRVLAELDAFKERYEIAEGDALWMVIDRDAQAWEEQMMSEVARRCYQHPNYRLAVSNPAFELWFLLHFVQVATLPEEEQQGLLENKKVSRNRTVLEARVSEQVGGFNKTQYDTQPFVDQVSEAIANAKALDPETPPQERWPEGLGTHVYLLAEQIISPRI